MLVVTENGYGKRTAAGVRGISLREDDVVEV
ncbi:hypothetical protein EDM27_17290 [Staphylococcus aureus]|nr:hypothetical protein EDM27_17290 [Staphylococcus aureus]